MYFETGNLYHIYNQGINKQNIFFNRENYIYFLKKIKLNILPHADILAWCLMPNHFHLMIYVHSLEVSYINRVAQSHKRDETSSIIHGVTLSDESIIHGVTSTDEPIIHGVTSSHPVNGNENNKTSGHPVNGNENNKISGHPVNGNTTNKSQLKSIILNDNIAIMLRSYTRAINEKYNRTGGLFREATKAECITKIQGISPSFFNTNHGAEIAIYLAEKEYPQICFDYIHFNPVKSGLVKKPEDWEFSSYQDYYGFRNGKLINRERINEFAIVL